MTAKKETTKKQLANRIEEIESKRGAASNDEIQELIGLRSELTFKTLWNFK